MSANVKYQLENFTVSFSWNLYMSILIHFSILNGVRMTFSALISIDRPLFFPYMSFIVKIANWEVSNSFSTLPNYFNQSNKECTNFCENW